MTVKEFALPDLGEGLTESEIVEWHVAVGDLVALNQPIAEVETAKAIVSLPSPVAGRISALHAEPGATVSVGTRIVTFDLDVAAETEGGTGTSTEGEPENVNVNVNANAEGASAPAAPERNAVLVGYGPAVESGTRPTRKPRAAQPSAPGEPASPEVASHSETSGARTMTTPPVRKLAHDAGIDLTQITGSGENGLITREDVTRAVESASENSGASATVSSSGGSAAAATRSNVGSREQRTPIKSVRKATAAAMVSSAFTAPHVTEFLTVDVTRTVKLVARLKEKGTAVSVLAVVAKALCLAVARNPSLNSKWDAEANEIVEFGYVNLGIAVATPRGLMVPNLKDAEAMSVTELTAAIAEMAENARASKATPASLNGGTISITNVGVFGIDAGTPILNPGEAAILAVGAVRKMPWEHRGKVKLREVMTLSLSFDHRLVDGEQGARFLTDIGTILNDPGTVLSMV